MLRDKTHDPADSSLSSSYVRRFIGPKATEIHVRCSPAGIESDDLATETEAVYRQLHEALSLEGAGLEDVVRETVFFRSIADDLEEFRRHRGRVLDSLGAGAEYRPACVCVGQPPMDGASRVEILVSAVVPRVKKARLDWTLSCALRCACKSREEIGGRVLLLGDEKHLFAGNIYGSPGSAFDEASSMFEVAEDILKQEGMDFRAVVRTWIYLRNMDRDYAEFNRARRAFFERTGVKLRPASTGINGDPFPARHNFVLGLYAIESPRPIGVSAMTTPTLNEAFEYGSDFSRGLRVQDENKVALYISGTASVDEQGLTAHDGDFDAQVERMLLNVEVLLERQGASFDDMVSAVTYLKRASDAARFREILAERGINGFPHVVVQAGVCRPELLCEIEGIALLPRKESS